MARKKQDKPAPSPVTIAQIQEAAREISMAKRAVEEASAAYRKVLKGWKGRGVDQGAMLEALASRKHDPEVVRLKMRDRVRYHVALNMPTKQDDLFAGLDLGAPEEDVQAKHADFEAEDSGFTAGRHGGLRSANPYAAGSSAHAMWDEGWRKGQESIAAEMQPGATIASGRGRKAREAVADDPMPKASRRGVSDADGLPATAH